MTEPIINKVAESGLITLDLAEYFPTQEIKIFDLKNYLFMGLILKEKDYREALKNTNWSEYENKNVCIICSADAIVPVWAYMLATQYLQGIAATAFLGTENQFKENYVLSAIENIDTNNYRDQRIVVKGCGDIDIPASAYVAITQKLKPVAKSIMYGEPCSTVPIYKKPIAK